MIEGVFYFTFMGRSTKTSNINKFGQLVGLHVSSLRSLLKIRLEVSSTPLLPPQGLAQGSTKFKVLKSKLIEIEIANLNTLRNPHNDPTTQP